jgi:hypothetical protein
VRRFLFVLLLLPIAWWAPTARADRQVQGLRLLPVVADASVHQSHPTQSFGGDAQLMAGYDLEASGPQGATGAVRALLRFDLSQVPPGSTIDSAILTVRLVSSWDTPESSVVCLLQRVASPWDETTVTWDTAPALAEHCGWATVAHAAWGWHSFDITRLAQAWQRGDSANYGVMLLGDETRPNWRGFSSREGLYPAQVVVSYQPPTATPSPTPTITLTPSVTPTPTEVPPTATATPGAIVRLPLIFNR